MFNSWCLSSHMIIWINGKPGILGQKSFLVVLGIIKRTIGISIFNKRTKSVSLRPLWAVVRPQSTIKLHFCTMSPKKNEAIASFFFIQAVGLVYHWRTKCGVYHQPLRGCISSRASVHLTCGLMIYNTSCWWYAIPSELMIYTPPAWFLDWIFHLCRRHNIIWPKVNILSSAARTSFLVRAAQKNEVALRANALLRNEVMLRINDVALRANGKLQFRPMSTEKKHLQSAVLIKKFGFSL